jgi:amino acid permease
MKLRKEKPHMDRPFKTPLYPFTPIMGIVLSVALLVAPTFLGDANAADALISGIGLTAVVIGTYYLRMAGLYRLQIAVGGIGIGVGISAAVLAFLVEAGFVAPIFPFIPSYIMLFISIVLIIGGILNFNAGAKMKERGTMDKQPEYDKTATS